MQKQFHINQLDSLVTSTSVVWINPTDIVGANYEKTRHQNYSQYHSDAFDEDETADEVIVDYITKHLWRHEHIKRVDAKTLVESTVFLIINLYSIVASERIGFWNPLITEDNVQECVSVVQNAYEEADSFARQLLRTFILEMFKYEGQPGYIFESCLNSQSLDFLKQLFENCPPNPYIRK